MAKKRAMVDAVLTCTAASDIFTQDLEEWDEEQLQSIEKASVTEKSNDIVNALKQIGLSVEENQGWMRIIGNTYGKQETLKQLGFKWYPQKKIWAKQVA